jgi:hypothetical protein
MSDCNCCCAYSTPPWWVTMGWVAQKNGQVLTPGLVPNLATAGTAPATSGAIPWLGSGAVPPPGSNSGSSSGASGFGPPPGNQQSAAQQAAASRAAQSSRSTGNVVGSIVNDILNPLGPLINLL